MLSVVTRGTVQAEGGKLIRENAILKTVLSAACVHIAYQDLEGKFLFVTPGIAQVYGVDQDTIEGRTVEELGVPGQLRDPFVVLRGEVIATGEPKSSEVRSPMTGLYYKYTIRPALGEDGQIVGTVSTAIDITERKSTEDELREEGEKLRAIMDSTNDAFYLKDREGRYLMANKKAIRATDKPENEVIGKRDDEVFADNEAARRLMALDRKVIESGIGITVEDIIPTRNGDLTFLSTKTPYHNAAGEIAGLVGISRDITERKGMEEALRASEERFRSLIEKAPIAISIVRNGVYEYVNPRYLEMFGYDELDDMRGHSIQEQTAPQDRARAREGIERLEQGLPESLENEFNGLRKDGTTFPFRVAVSKVELADGPVMVGFLTDITQRRRAEEGLRESEMFLRGVMDNASDAMFVKDRECRMVMANPAYYRMLGRRPEEVVGRKVDEYYSPELAAKMIAVERGVVLTGITETVEEGLVTPNGPRTFQTTLAPYRDTSGRIVGYIGIARDVTERKITQEAILEERRKFEALFSAANEGIALHHNVYDDQRKVIDYRVIDVNPAYEAITGIPREQAVGKLASELYGTGQPPYLEMFTGVGETGVPASMETYFDPMGKHFKISIFSPAKGQFATIFIDITDRKRLEQELEEAKARAELYVDLLTHDITNYNTAAMGYLQIAELRLALDDRQKQLIVRPLQVLRNSSELIANIRDLKRVETGRDRIEPVDVCRMLREVKDEYDNPPGKEVRIVLDAPVHCWVMGSGLLRDAFSNIVSNAINHSSGPVTVFISMGTVVKDRRQMCQVSISDTGPGIPDDRKDKIFDRAMMGLNKPVSRGLGLYMVKRLVEDYNGDVRVEDRVPGDHTKGAMFVIELPMPPTP